MKKLAIIGASYLQEPLIEKAKFIKNNLDNLKDEYIEKFNKSFLSYDGTYYNIRSAYTTLKQWLSMPNRVKEFKND